MMPGAIRTPKSCPPEAKINVDYDMAWGGGDYTFNKLKGMGILLPLDAAIVKQAIPNQSLSGVDLYAYESPASKNIVWAGVCLSSFGIVYNPDLLAAINITEPTRWDDLTTTSLRGRVALADPSHSGSAGVAYMMVLQRAMVDSELRMANYARWQELSRRKFDKERDDAGDIADPIQRQQKRAAIATDKLEFANLDHDHDKALATGWKIGMGRLLLIAANARYFTDSAERVPTDVGNGDAAEGMAIDFYGRMEQSIVGRSGRGLLLRPTPRRLPPIRWASCMAPSIRNWPGILWSFCCRPKASCCGSRRRDTLAVRCGNRWAGRRFGRSCMPIKPTGPIGSIPTPTRLVSISAAHGWRCWAMSPNYGPLRGLMTAMSF